MIACNKVQDGFKNCKKDAATHFTVIKKESQIARIFYQKPFKLNDLAPLLEKYEKRDKLMQICADFLAAYITWHVLQYVSGLSKKHRI